MTMHSSELNYHSKEHYTINTDRILEISATYVDKAADVLVSNLPEMKQITGEIVELLFVPRTVARQLLLVIALEAGVVTANQVYLILRRIYSNFSSRSRLIRQLEKQQQCAETQDEWMDLAEQIDNIQGNDIWRSEHQCSLYESDRISNRIDEFLQLMRRRDIFELMFTLRGCIARNKFGLLHEGLFSKALAGSKVLVETYHNVVCATLDFVCDAPVPSGAEPIPTETRLAFFNETRHSYGRTALLLSGGAALGFYHVGVVKALMDNGLLPRVISGASAGSILASMIGTRTDEECQMDLFHQKGTVAPGHSGKLVLNFFRPLPNSRDIATDPVYATSEQKANNDILEVYKNTAGGFHDGKRTFQLLFPIGLRKFTSFVYDVLVGHRRAQDMLKSDTVWFRECCRTNIGEMTFQEAFDRTGRILNIIVSPQNRSDPPRLLNYLTTPHVVVWSAAVASSSLPGVFESNKLLVKNADGSTRFESAIDSRFIDGSMEADLPMQQLSEMFNINHFIISQANPHAVFLASFDRNRSLWSNGIFNFIHGVLVFLKKQVKAWIGNVIELIGAQRAAPHWDTRRGFGSQFFTQEYEGRETDITLVPWASHRSLISALLHVLYNPSEVEFKEWAHAAERETWRYIPKIKSHVAEEITLDRCVQRLRKQLIKESTEKRSGQSTNEQLSIRVPSFFTSASLVNMSGLAITDRFSIKDSEPGDVWQDHEFGDLDIKAEGWKGMGLKGNFSSGSLNRSPSLASGIFPLDEEGGEEQVASSGHFISHLPMAQKKSSDSHIHDSTSNNEQCYVKTTSMANFYYRNACGLGHVAPTDIECGSYDHWKQTKTLQQQNNSRESLLDQMSL